MALAFTESASKHGFTEEQAVHAVENSWGHVKEFTDPRPPATIRPWLFIGPAGPYDVTPLEVFVNIVPGRRGPDLTIFHVMVATEENLNKVGRSYR